MAGDQWDMDEAYPPVLWKDYRPLCRKLAAEWLRLAGLTCDEDYQLDQVAHEISMFVTDELRRQANPPRLDITRLTRREDE